MPVIFTERLGGEPTNLGLLPTKAIIADDDTIMDGPRKLLGLQMMHDIELENSVYA